MGLLYILDEPSIGLHLQRDNERLIATLERLRDLENTVIVVEHDEGYYSSCNYICRYMGPHCWQVWRRLWLKGTPADIA